MTKRFDHTGLSMYWKSPLSDKIEFLNELTDFICSGFQQCEFSTTIYKQLNGLFSVKADNQSSYYESFFSSPLAQFTWFNHVNSYQVLERGEDTYSDVERVFQTWTSSKEGKLIIAKCRISASYQ